MEVSNVTAIFKKGKNVVHYRPISLTVNICKVFESIRDKIVEHLEKHTLVRDSQHGFVRNNFCLTNLLVFVEEVANYLDSGYPVDVIYSYLDFQNAFDKVPHKRLILKLAAHGIGGKLSECIEKWLLDRKQRVIINWVFSGWKDVLSGVPEFCFGTIVICDLY